MKIRNILLIGVIMAIYGTNAYKANVTIQQTNNYTLNNIEQLAEGERIIRNGRGRYDCKYVPSSGRCKYTDGAFMICYIFSC